MTQGTLGVYLAARLPGFSTEKPETAHTNILARLAYSPTSWHNCPSLCLRPGSQAIFQPGIHSLLSPETSARLAGIRTRIQGSAQCPRNQPQGRRFVSFLTYTKLPRIVCTQPARLSNVSKYTNFHSQSFWIIFTYTHVRSIWSYIEVYLLYHYFYHSNANTTNRLSQNLNITQSHASIYKTPCSSGGNFTCTYLSWLFLLFCQSCMQKSFSPCACVRCCVPLADCACAPPVFIRDRYDACVCAYFRSTIFPIWTFISVPPAAAFFCLLHVLLFHYFTTITYLI